VELLRSRADREHKAAGELREAAERLEQALRELPEGRSVGQGLALGRVPAPVRGALRLAFGLQVEPEFGTETLRTGVEFAAPEGAPVRAVAPGRVLFAGWFRGYGQMVILDHGKGSLTVSGYLGEMAVAADDSVDAGQLIGSVGRTGTLGEPGLYFEIRKDGQAVDPERWLR
jgi:septal ring factor EnvC (AmiA/AmiB activator)